MYSVPVRLRTERRVRQWSLVAAADYYVEFRPGKEPEISWKDKISDFLAQPEITVMKKTKRSEKEIEYSPV